MVRFGIALMTNGAKRGCLEGGKNPRGLQRQQTLSWAHSSKNGPHPTPRRGKMMLIDTGMLSSYYHGGKHPHWK